MNGVSCDQRPLLGSRDFVGSPRPLVPRGAPPLEYERVYEVLCDFLNADASGQQVPVRRGERVLTSGIRSHGWDYVVKSDGSTGWVPSAYVSLVSHSFPNYPAPDARGVRPPGWHGYSGKYNDMQPIPLFQNGSRLERQVESEELEEGEIRESEEEKNEEEKGETKMRRTSTMTSGGGGGMSSLSTQPMYSTTSPPSGIASSPSGIASSPSGIASSPSGIASSPSGIASPPSSPIISKPLQRRSTHRPREARRRTAESSSSRSSPQKAPMKKKAPRERRTRRGGRRGRRKGGGSSEEDGASSSSSPSSSSSSPSSSSSSPSSSSSSSSSTSRSSSRASSHTSSLSSGKRRKRRREGGNACGPSRRTKASSPKKYRGRAVQRRRHRRRTPSSSTSTSRSSSSASIRALQHRKRERRPHEKDGGRGRKSELREEKNRRPREDKRSQNRRPREAESSTSSDRSRSTSSDLHRNSVRVFTACNEQHHQLFVKFYRVEEKGMPRSLQHMRQMLQKHVGLSREMSNQICTVKITDNRQLHFFVHSHDAKRHILDALQSRMTHVATELGWKIYDSHYYPNFTDKLPSMEIEPHYRGYISTFAPGGSSAAFSNGGLIGTIGVGGRRELQARYVCGECQKSEVEVGYPFPQCSTCRWTRWCSEACWERGRRIHAMKCPKLALMVKCHNRRLWTTKDEVNHGHGN